MGCELTAGGAAIVVVGAGPQALCLCAQLLRKRPRWRRHLRVIDPAGAWLSRWRRQMHRLEVPMLRSPAPHHPHPNPNALRDYAHGRGRGHQLHGPFGQPHTGLFSDFCQQLIDSENLAALVRPGQVRELRLAPCRSGPLELSLASGERLQARQLVLACGPGEPRWPAWALDLPPLHPPAALQHSRTLNLPALGRLDGQRVLVVGGGLTSGHLALGALERGATVELLCRRRLRAQPFDSDPGWLGPKRLKAFAAEPSWQRRRQLVRQARGGGSLTPEVRHRLEQARRGGRLRLHEQIEVRQLHWGGSHWQVACSDGSALTVERIWLATGHQQGVSHQPLLRQLQRQRPLELVDDWPVLSPELGWGGAGVFVMGGLSALQLGPAAATIHGGREGARRITAGLLHRCPPASATVLGSGAESLRAAPER
ncbi:SidA/IucD/PvdA family monooxygenase [Cyanobium sp. ATX 6A2]|uniref:FAD/NAD(P)-binding protein n=1 Tax=Cyanobium sp. ATX 6A2 TaxID=2823700 RepID=UPI0020CECCCB|nr:FAD/NAD(P)-binding protein [Cyanobium sp. ATX 6A2]MCP9888189.1 SidA/IucD/PvdA family monooxygenase [Cyanobium sp. ATX 6A2]